MVESKNIPPPLRRAGIEEDLRKLCEENDVVFMAVFGSFARDEQDTGSDVDVTIEYDPGTSKTLFDLVRLEDQLRDLFGRDVDLGILDAISPYIIDDVKREMKVIYENR